MSLNTSLCSSINENRSCFFDLSFLCDLSLLMIRPRQWCSATVAEVGPILDDNWSKTTKRSSCAFDPANGVANRVREYFPSDLWPRRSQAKPGGTRLDFRIKRTRGDQIGMARVRLATADFRQAKAIA